MAGQDSPAASLLSNIPTTPPALSPNDYSTNQGNLQDVLAPNGASNFPVTTSSVANTNGAKKGAKNKKAADPNETGKLLAAKINQLELDAAGEKDQEAEIGQCHLHPNKARYGLSSDDLPSRNVANSTEK